MHGPVSGRVHGHIPGHCSYACNTAARLSYIHLSLHPSVNGACHLGLLAPQLQEALPSVFTLYNVMASLGVAWLICLLCVTPCFHVVVQDTEPEYCWLCIYSVEVQSSLARVLWLELHCEL